MKILILIKYKQSKKIYLKIIDLELSDLMNCSPSLNTRTPGQLLSLTSHLSFGSIDRRQASNDPQIKSNLMKAMNRQSKCQ